jgi:hypothetical protein
VEKEGMGGIKCEDDNVGMCVKYISELICSLFLGTGL